MTDKISKPSSNCFSFSKPIVLSCVILLACLRTYSQTVQLTRASVKVLENEGEEVIKLGNPLKLGVSIGYNIGLKELHDATISPINNTVQFERTSPFSVVLSTAAMFSVRTFSLRKKKDLAGPNTLENTEGPVFELPSNWSIGAIVNIAQFSGESNLYNQKIDGGLGIGFQLNENIFFLGSLELLSVKQPRDFFLESFNGKNQQLKIDNALVKNLNYDDTSLFRNTYIPSISLKVVFGLSLTKQSGTEKSQVGSQQRLLEQPAENEIR
jgi:hypothetical protein